MYGVYILGKCGCWIGSDLRYTPRRSLARVWESEESARAWVEEAYGSFARILPYEVRPLIG